MTSSSPKKILPSLGFRSPAIIYKVVDFPQPDGPKRPTNLPDGIVISKDFTATVSDLSLAWNIFVILSNLISIVSLLNKISFNTILYYIIG